METFPGTSVFKNHLKNTLHIKMLLKRPTGGKKMNTSNKSFTVILNAHLNTMECLTICKIEGKAKSYNCLILGKTRYFLFFFFFPILAKRKWYYNIFREKATRNSKLIIPVA